MSKKNKWNYKILFGILGLIIIVSALVLLFTPSNDLEPVESTEEDETEVLTEESTTAEADIEEDETEAYCGDSVCDIGEETCYLDCGCETDEQCQEYGSYLCGSAGDCYYTVGTTGSSSSSSSDSSSSSSSSSETASTSEAECTEDCGAYACSEGVCLDSCDSVNDEDCNDGYACNYYIGECSADSDGNGDVDYMECSPYQYELSSSSCGSSCDGTQDCDSGYECVASECVVETAVTSEICYDGLDEDGDGLVDCADDDCSSDSLCLESGNCADGYDNDLDGSEDCDDSDCSDDESCATAGIAEICYDGLDEDGDGLVDCADDDCSSDSLCLESGNCADGYDNDLDGSEDCDDSDCSGDSECISSPSAAPESSINLINRFLSWILFLN